VLLNWEKTAFGQARPKCFKRAVEMYGRVWGNAKKSLWIYDKVTNFEEILFGKCTQKEF
jgi:hypothetical protein